MKIDFIYTNYSASRLDLVVYENIKLRSQFDGLSRSQIKLWISNGQVLVNGKVVTKAGSIIKKGYSIEIDARLDCNTQIEPSNLPLDILYEDDDVLVINKPAGLAMHPGAGRKSSTLANAVAGHINTKEFPIGVRPGIVHRLDMDTTGVVVVAKNIAAHSNLSAQFAKKTTGRRYTALVYSTPRARREIMKRDEGVIDTNLGRHPNYRKQFAVVKIGKRAVTHWKVIDRMSYAALLSLKLETGRTHQIRVHMDYIGSPVIGDRVYGDFSGLPSSLKAAAQKFGRQALHAAVLEFDHPKTKKRVLFEADMPDDLAELIKIFRKYA